MTKQLQRHCWRCTMHTRKHYGDRGGNGYYDNRTQPETSQFEERRNVCWFMFGIIRPYVEFLAISKLKKCVFLLYTNQ